MVTVEENGWKSCVKPEREKAEMEIYSHVVWCGNTWKTTNFKVDIRLKHRLGSLAGKFTNFK